MSSVDNVIDIRQQRIANALWGLFVGDALAMPAHGIHHREKLREMFGSAFSGYCAPPDDSAVSGTNGHPHQGLQPGANTLEAHLVRALLRSVASAGRYDPRHFLEEFLLHLTTPGRNCDPHMEPYLSRWLENHAGGAPLHACAAWQGDDSRIGSTSGVIRPLVVSMLARSAYQGMGAATGHQQLTHKADNCVTALFLLVPMLQGLLSGEDPMGAIPRFGRLARLPLATGSALQERCQGHDAVSDPDRPESERLHAAFETRPFDLEYYAEEVDPEDVAGVRLDTGMYVEHAGPLLLYTGRMHLFDFERSLTANALIGGDTVHRGMVLGLLLGAVKAPPRHLIDGLVESNALAAEIEAFAKLATTGQSL